MARDLLSMLRDDLMEVLCSHALGDPLVARVIEEVCERLQQRCGGDRVLVPKIDRVRRDEEVRRLSRTGCLPEAISRELELPLSTVYRILNRKRRPAGETGEQGFGSEEWNL